MGDRRRSVWKYQLDLADEPQPVYMPQDATIVHVACQGMTPCLWVEVEPGPVDDERWFVVEGTGHPIEHEGTHVGTGMDHMRGLVWHVYETTGVDR